MKTLKIVLVVLGVIITSGLIRVNAQVQQEKDLPFSFCGWIGCANNGQGELICGTVYQHAVIHFDKNGNPDRAHYNYKKSEFIGIVSGEKFTLFGASNMGEFPFYPFEFNETIQLKGNMGTKIVVRTKYHITPEGEFIMDLYFEKCV